jgi:hypothetical protein
MSKLLFEFIIEVPIEQIENSFNELAEFVVYLDGGSPARISIDLNQAYEVCFNDFKEKISKIQSNYPGVQID